MKIKKFKKLLENYYHMNGLTTISKSHKRHKCDGCGLNIEKNSYYISISIYANLWYRMHLSTICRAKAIIAWCIFEDHDELTRMRDDELIEWFSGIKTTDSWQNIARELGFKDFNDVIKQIRYTKRLLPINEVLQK